MKNFFKDSFDLGLQMLVSLLLASFAIFLILEVLPGDPAALMLGMEARADTLNALRQQLGLDQPWFIRYFQWIGGMLQGDFGISFTYHVPVAELINERLLVSLPLACFTLFLTIIIALPAGIYAAAHQNKKGDSFVFCWTQLNMAIPNFWLAIMLIFIFSLQLKWFAAGGFSGWQVNDHFEVGAFFLGFKSLVLPAIALALPQAAILTRMTRAAMGDVLHFTYIRTARAKGASNMRVLWIHALPNAIIILITLLGLQFSFLIAGAVIIENVFYLPGLGRLLFQAIAQRDLIVVKNLVMLMVASVIIVNMLISLLERMIDPRLRSR